MLFECAIIDFFLVGAYFHQFLNFSAFSELVFLAFGPLLMVMVAFFMVPRMAPVSMRHC
jgi:hypothetical protein